MQIPCGHTHIALRHATHRDPVLVSQQGLSLDHQCNHQGFFSDFQQFTAVFIWMTSHNLCSRASWDCGRVKNYCATEGVLHNRQTSSPPQRDKKQGIQTYVHARAHTMLEPPGQTDWCHWFSAITASVTESSRGKQTNTPRGLATQTTLALALPKYAFAALKKHEHFPSGVPNLNICKFMSSFFRNEIKLKSRSIYYKQ